MIKLISAAAVGYSGYHFGLHEQNKRDLQGMVTGFMNTFGAVYVVSAAVIDYKWTLRDLTYNTKEYFAERSIVHARVAEKILALSLNNRGVYLKAGQYIGNLERIMPKEYTQCLKVLQDSGPSQPFEEIKIVIEHDLNEKCENIFSSFDPKAIAAASLAQVHQAILKKNGQKVAVKLQFPSLRTQYKYDLMVIGALSSLCDRLITLFNGEELKLNEIFQTFASALRKELNFLEEAENGKKTQEILKQFDQVHIPRYYDEYSGQRMLVMEFVEGSKINDVEAIKAQGLDPKECAQLLIDMFGTMIFKYGHVHCDAHPGNILVRPMSNNPKKAQIVLLDHGFYTEIPQDILQIFRRLWVSLAKFDYEESTRQARLLGMEDSQIEYLPLIFFYRTRNSTKKLGEVFQKEERTYVRGKELAALESVSRLMRSLPSELLFVIRAANLVGIHNATLGGSTRERLKKFTRYAMAQVYTNPITYIMATTWLSIRLFLFENLQSLYRMIFQ